ncbi:MAG: DUF1097 domain-containing protein [Lachnospiraceae bacterium]|nr:DUF1097 domain-containing protein [Lachnospiraceae bacterium]MBQ6857061.1 DUF1097 domain-containing protein [Lachnospiraceae bacterium]
MKKMNALFSLSVVTAVLCGIWSVFAGWIGLIGWAGFAGCTTYFACGEHGADGVKKAMMTNLVGVMCGYLTIIIGKIWPVLGEWGIACAMITFLMCMVSKYKVLNYCPGIFVGCFSSFAAAGDWTGLVIALLLGAVLGMACDLGGDYLFKRFQK